MTPDRTEPSNITLRYLVIISRGGVGEKSAALQKELSHDVTMDVSARSMLCCGAIFPRHYKATLCLIRGLSYQGRAGYTKKNAEKLTQINTKLFGINLYISYNFAIHIYRVSQKTCTSLIFVQLIFFLYQLIPCDINGFIMEIYGVP